MPLQHVNYNTVRNQQAAQQPAALGLLFALADDGDVMVVVEVLLVMMVMPQHRCMQPLASKQDAGTTHTASMPHHDYLPTAAQHTQHAQHRH
jgi:hypothetical protein